MLSTQGQFTQTLGISWIWYPKRATILAEFHVEPPVISSQKAAAEEMSSKGTLHFFLRLETETKHLIQQHVAQTPGCG